MTVVLPTTDSIEKRKTQNTLRHKKQSSKTQMLYCRTIRFQLNHQNENIFMKKVLHMKNSKLFLKYCLVKINTLLSSKKIESFFLNTNKLIFYSWFIYSRPSKPRKSLTKTINWAKKVFVIKTKYITQSLTALISTKKRKQNIVKEKKKNKNISASKKTPVQ